MHGRGISSAVFFKKKEKEKENVAIDDLCGHGRRVCFKLDTSCPILPFQAFPPGALHPLPKRQALEKSNGASTVFNPSVLHYQQALTSAQLQQHAAFIPTGTCPDRHVCVRVLPVMCFLLISLSCLVESSLHFRRRKDSLDPTAALTT